MAQLAALLRTDLSRMAEEVRRAGRGKDTILAHITPREAALLKARGGSGELNPNTGLPEFQTDDEMYGFGYEGAPYTGQAQPSPVIQSQDLYQPSGYPSEGEFGLGQPIGGQGMPLTEPAYGLGMYGAETMPSAATPQIDLTRAGGIGSQGFGATEPIELGIAGGMAGAPSVSPPQEKSVLDRIQAGLKTPLGAGLAGGLPAALLARSARKGAEQSQRELAALGQPFIESGRAKVAQAQAGQLSAAQQQALEAQRLAGMQNLQRRGVESSTAVAQLENQLMAQRAKFLDDLLNQGYREIAQGNAYITQGIQAATQANAQARQLLGSFASNYMAALAKTGKEEPPYTTSTTTPPRT